MTFENLLHSVLFVGLFLLFVLFIYIKKTNLNTLYCCNKCERFFRRWQSELFSAVNGHSEKIGQCPHCEVTGERSDINYDGVYHLGFADLANEKELRWLLKHPDCPVMKYKELLQFYDKVFSCQRPVTKDSKIEKQEQYKKMSKSDWLERLEQKTQKK